MIGPENFKKIKKIVEEFFEKIGIDFELNITFSEDSVKIDLKTESPQLFIGNRGQTLAEIQYLLKIILRKRVQETIFIDLDIADYKKKKIERLKDLAHSIADEVALTKEERELPSMPAFARRIVHLELAGRKDVTTESIDREPERKILIKPIL